MKNKNITEQKKIVFIEKEAYKYNNGITVPSCLLNNFLTQVGNGFTQISSFSRPSHCSCTGKNTRTILWCRTLLVSSYWGGPCFLQFTKLLQHLRLFFWQSPHVKGCSSSKVLTLKGYIVWCHSLSLNFPPKEVLRSLNYPLCFRDLYFCPLALSLEAPLYHFTPLG